MEVLEIESWQSHSRQPGGSRVGHQVAPPVVEDVGYQVAPGVVKDVTYGSGGATGPR